MSSTLEISLQNGKPHFVYEMQGWRFEADYTAHKTLTDAQTDIVTEHAFFVQVDGYEEVHTEDGFDSILGETYRVFTFELGSRPRVVKHDFTNRGTLNNWTFAHRLFVQLFGCGYDASEPVPGHLYWTSTFSETKQLPVNV